MSTQPEPGSAYGAERLWNSGFSIGINDNNGHYKVTAFVDNALDKRYAKRRREHRLRASAAFREPWVSTWSLPRDAFRYYGARFDVSFLISFDD